jgi:hypothetical protein
LLLFSLINSAKRYDNIKKKKQAHIIAVTCDPKKITNTVATGSSQILSANRYSHLINSYDKYPIPHVSKKYKTWNKINMKKDMYSRTPYKFQKFNFPRELASPRSGRNPSIPGLFLLGVSL